MSIEVHDASRHFVLSALLRLGHSASSVTSGRGPVDIVLERAGGIQTLQVRGSIVRRDWSVRDAQLLSPTAHFLALLYWGELAAEPRTLPELWILPQSSVSDFTRTVAGLEPMLRVHGQRLERNGAQFRDAWYLLGVPPAI